MASGCPVISSARGSLQEVVGAAALIVEPEEVGHIARALGRLAGDPAERERWRAAGLVNAQRFDWNRNAAETLEVYRDACLRGKS